MPETDVREVRAMPGTGAHVVTSPRRSPGADEVRLEPLAVGVCGTDAHIVAGTFPAVDGVVLGHEVCGRVVQVGPVVKSLAVGDLVTVEPHRYCTACTYCRAGREHLCVDKAGYGVRLDGGMTESMVVPARIAYRLPPGTPPWLGALAEPLSCCIHAADRLAVTSGESLLVYGCGPAGAMLVALVRHLGAYPVVAMDPTSSRRDLALRMGADLVLDPRDPASDRLALEQTDAHGFQHVVDAVGSAAVLSNALAMAGRGGRVLEFGVADPAERLSLSPNDLFKRELTLLGSVINPYTHQRAVALLERLPLAQMTHAFFGLDEFDAALDAQRAGRVDKVFIAPHGAARAAAATTP